MIGLSLIPPGAALVVLPFLTWFTARMPGGDASISGVSAAGALWGLPVLGGLIVACGVLVRLRRHPSGAAVGALGAAIAACVWCALALGSPPLRVEANRLGALVDVPLPTSTVPVSAAAAGLWALACAAVCGLLAVVALAVRSDAEAAAGQPEEPSS